MILLLSHVYACIQNDDSPHVNAPRLLRQGETDHERRMF